MNGIVRPKRTTIVHIRSKDALQLETSLNTNFRVQLVSAIECSNTEEIHAQLISAEIPNSAYNVSSQVENDTIVYDDTVNFTFPNKNYDVDEIVSVINDDNTFPFSVSYDEYTNRLTFTNTDTVAHTLNWTLSNARKLLGFGLSDDTEVASLATTTSSGMVDLATIHSVMIKSDLAAGNVLSTRAGNSTTLQKISIDVNTYGIIYLNQQDYRTVSVLQKPVVDSITFQLTDQNNNLLDLNDINFEFSIQFMIFDRQGVGRRRAIEEQTPSRSPPIDIPNRQPNRQPVLTGVPDPQPLVQGNDLFMMEEDMKEADDTHPVEGKTQIEKVAEKTILDHIIDAM